MKNHSLIIKHVQIICIRSEYLIKGIANIK